MKVLVTGGSGFLGSRVLDSLAERGYEIIALSSQPADNRKAEANISWVCADIHSSTQIDRLIQSLRPAGLMHLAWETTHGAYWNSLSNLRWTASSLHLIESFLRHGGKRIVVAGTSAEYTWGGDEKLHEYTTQIQPRGLYGVSKNALREILQSSASENDVSWAWGRIFNLFGEGEKNERLIPKVISKLLADEKLPFDDGMLYRDFLHVDDAGDAFAALFDSQVQGPVNIASGEPVTIKSLVETISNILGKLDLVQFGSVSNNNNESTSVVASVDRLHKEVGWSPLESFYARLQSTCECLKIQLKIKGEIK